jgi:hypothetical protein
MCEGGARKMVLSCGGSLALKTRHTRLLHLFDARASISSVSINVTEIIHIIVVGLSLQIVGRSSASFLVMVIINGLGFGKYFGLHSIR